MAFPYGRAPLAILIIAVVTGAWIGITTLGEEDREEPDLIFATFAKDHALAYKPAIERFEKERGVTVQLQVVDAAALDSRLAAAMLAGAKVPDIVELEGRMGAFTNGPIEDIGFVDLTDKVHEHDLLNKVVASRFSQWSSRGHIFGLPHDVHPMMLLYNRELLEELGVDANELTTWDKFAEVARSKVVKDFDGDGTIDHYMLDLPLNSGIILRALLLQRGGRLFDENGNVAFDSPEAADVLEWHIKQSYGPDRIAFPAGWGQALAQAAMEGLVLFYFAPDWRTRQIQNDIPSMSGKMALMPMPAWENGGLRTSTWGGTGLAFTKQVVAREKFDLAWDLAMYLYYDAEQLGARFKQTNILPPLKSVWDQSLFDAPYPYFSDQPLGRLYADLGDDVPADNASPYEKHAIAKLLEAMTRSAAHYEGHGEDGLREKIEAELKRTADQIRRRIDRNVFLAEDDE